MTRRDKGKLIIRFVPLYTLSLFSKIVCSLWLYLQFCYIFFTFFASARPFFLIYFIFLRVHFSSCASFCVSFGVLRKKRGSLKSTQKCTFVQCQSMRACCYVNVMTWQWIQLTLLEKVENSRSAWKKVALSKFKLETNFTALNSFFFGIKWRLGMRSCGENVDPRTFW